MIFSLIIPCFNEEENLKSFFPVAVSCFEAADVACEFIFVDDGSSDATVSVLREKITDYSAKQSGLSAFKVIELSRNFGKEAALYAGLQHATGDYVGFIDADMQQDPEVSLTMLRYLLEHPDCDCVAAMQERRRESAPLRACKKLFYRVFNAMSETRIEADVSDFRVFTRQVAAALASMHEYFRFSKGLFAWVGFKTHIITYQAHERLAGSSKWTLRKLISYAWNGVLAFSTMPLKLVMWAGGILALVSLCLLGIDMYDQIALNEYLPLSQVVLYVVLLLGGLQMFVLGILGEYVARAYIESKRRPVFLERRAFVQSATQQPAASDPWTALSEATYRASKAGSPDASDERQA